MYSEYFAASALISASVNALWPSVTYFMPLAVWVGSGMEVSPELSLPSRWYRDSIRSILTLPTVKVFVADFVSVKYARDAPAIAIAARATQRPSTRSFFFIFFGSFYFCASKAAKAAFASAKPSAWMASACTSTLTFIVPSSDTRIAPLSTAFWMFALVASSAMPM